MLKIWKKTWKDKDSDATHSAQSAQDTETEDTTSTPISSSLQAAVPGHVGTKRSRSSIGPEGDMTDSTGRPTKISKISNAPLRYHLPEVLEDDESLTPASLSVLMPQALEQAKRENTILVLPLLKCTRIPKIKVSRLIGNDLCLTAAMDFMIQVLTWAIEVERVRSDLDNSVRRPALVVLEDEDLLEHYTSILQTGMPGTSVARYTEEEFVSKTDVRLNALRPEIMLVPSRLLLKSLVKGMLTITQIHSLIIGDGHRIRDQDSHSSIPIVQVMDDHYRAVDPLSRPRILAIIAPSTSRSSHFDSRMLRVEQTLAAKVCGVTETQRAEILALPDRPNEMTIIYEPPDMSETSLFRQLRQLDATATVFQHHFRTSRYAQAELGSCASDLIWRRALKEMETNIPTGYSSEDDNEGRGASVASATSRMCNVVKNWVFPMPNLDSSSRGFNVSHKFLRLVQALEACEPYRDGFRGIIFVQRRAVALVMADLLRTLGQQLRFIRPYAVVEHASFSDFNQREVFHNFVTGTYNLLIATKFMEDLDVPKASVVIRYDLFDSQVSHAYARARSRGRESHLVHMVERGNDAHRRILSKITKLDADMLHWTEAICRTPQSAIPPHTLHETTVSYDSESEDEADEPPEESIKDAITGGRINIRDATTVLYRFAATIAPQIMVTEGSQPLFAFEDVYEESEANCAYICRVLLPGTSVDRTLGSPAPSKAEARRSASIKACRNLFQDGLLDYRLFPLPSSLLARRDFDHRMLMNDNVDPSDQNFTGSRCYPRKQPDFWSNTGSLPIKTLYPIVINIGHVKDDLQPRAPMVLLTRQPLPELASFRIFFSGAHELVRFQRGAIFSVDEARLNDIYNYTIRVCRAITNRPLTCPLEEMVYFLAPLPLDWTMPKDLGLELPDIMSDVPWKQVSVAAEAWAVPLMSHSSDNINDLEDTLIQDRWVEFTRRYNYVKLRTDLTPFSKPEDSPREAGYDSLLAFCQAKLKGFQGLKDDQQPIIEVDQVPAVVNNLNPTSIPAGTPSSKLSIKCIPPLLYEGFLANSKTDLIPELCAKFTLPASVLCTAVLLPSILRRIDDFLLVKELNARFFDHAIREDLLHAAICPPSAGVEYDYERLELLGDAFLKYLSTVYVSVANPADSQHSLHIARQNIISNKALWISSNRVGLPSYIQSKVFRAKTWQPPNFQVQQPPRSSKLAPTRSLDSGTIPGVKGASENLKQQGPQTESGSTTSVGVHPSGPASAPVQTETQSKSSTNASSQSSQVDKSDSDGEGTQPKKRKKRKRHNQDDEAIQWLGDKTVADVAEAIIGAAYISGGRETALQVTKALTVSVPNIDRWSDLGRKVLAPPPEITAKLRPGSIKSVEAVIGHKFHRPHLLAQALTHSSMEGQGMISYERLEFIGDAILDFMVIRYIFDRYQQLSPGALTLLKSAMVSNSTLAAICVWSGLQKYVLLDSYNVASSIEEYACALNAKQIREYQLAEEEQRSPGQFWNELKPPKTLSDVVESVIGAIYISDKFSPVGTEAFFDNVLKPFYDKHITFKSLSHHPTKLLYEVFQAQGCHQLEIVTEKSEDTIYCHVVVHDVILAIAESPTSMYAVRSASAFALDALEGDGDFLKRTCDCRSQTAGKKPKNGVAFEQVMASLRKDAEEDGTHQPNGLEGSRLST